METSGSIALWQRLEQIEQSLCLRVNRGCRYPSVKALFSVVSRLGDGGFWYLLMLVLAVNCEHHCAGRRHPPRGSAATPRWSRPAGWTFQ
jgi:hypothetical protein